MIEIISEKETFWTIPILQIGLSSAISPSQISFRAICPFYWTALRILKEYLLFLMYFREKKKTR
jgi:hypothetical protein